MLILKSLPSKNARKWTLSLLFFAHFAQAQNLPTVIPPSPSTQQFEKYGNYPVSNFTGIPDINIPLYTIKEGDITIPVTLNYHASGTKPSDQNGLTGLGWTLTTVGKVSRTIFDRPDELWSPVSPMYTVAQLMAMQPWQREYYFKYTFNNGDFEPDVYSYNFAGHVGKFVLNFDSQRTPLLFPYKPLAFTVGASTIDVKDEKGVQYQFYPSESN